MKQIKIMILGLFGLLLMAFIAFIPIHTNAATIENGQTVKLLKKGQQFYKFTLEDDALVQIKWVDNANDESQCIIYDNKTRNYSLRYDFIQGKSGRYFLAMRKGTYYLDLYDNSTAPSTKVTINWTPASKYDKGNFSAQTAQNLQPEVLVRAPQVGFYNYYRWYKIKVTRAHKITLTVPYGDVTDVEFLILNSKYNVCVSMFNISDDRKSSTTSKKLAIGTYYILIPPESYGSKIGYPVAFKWK